MNIDLNKKVMGRIGDSMRYLERKPELAKGLQLADSDLKSFEDKGVHAGIMRNFQSRVMDSVEGRNFMTTNNYGPYLPELLPVIIAWYPEFPLRELISVQDMEQDLAYIITSELVTGTNKAPTKSGELVETPNGKRVIRGSYPTGEIMGEVLKKDTDLVVSGSNLEGALFYMPLIMNEEAQKHTQFKVTNGSGDKVAVFEGVSGNVATFKDSTSAVTVKVTLDNGIISVSDTTATQVEASYIWNIEYAKDTNIPTVVEDMKMQPMQAKPRVIAMKWTIFSEYVKKSQFGDDIRTQTTKRVLDLMFQLLVRYILDKMYHGATGTSAPVTINNIGTTVYDANLKAQDQLKQLNAVSMTIAKNTGRIEGNRLVIGSNYKNYLESLPNTLYKQFESTSDYGFQGPRKIGEFGRFTVFYDNELPDDEGFMTYKGSQWYDAAYYLGVFLPIAPTDAINIDVQVRQAFVAMEAHKYDKPNAVVKLKFNAQI